MKATNHAVRCSPRRCTRQAAKNMNPKAKRVSASATEFRGCGCGITIVETCAPAMLVVEIAPTRSCSSPVGRTTSTTTDAQRAAVSARSQRRGRTPV